MTLSAKQDQAQARLPESTYRLQFHKDFTFRDATAIVPYLADLGITHVYASPYLRARPGSTHGYDVIDHCRLNPELGTQSDFDALCAALDKHGMSHILDTVPNHVGVGTNENAWWNDVLENGPASIYGGYFDIAWRSSPRPELHDKVLIPVLGSPYAEVLEKRELRVAFEHGAFGVYYYDRRFPISPRTYWRILSHELEKLTSSLAADNPELMEYLSILRAIHFLPDRSDTGPLDVAERHREKEIIKRRLDALIDQSQTIQDFVMRGVDATNGSPDLLDALLSHQCYRLSYWHVASDEINYRRFFDINDLAALAQERQDVFDATHKFVLSLVQEGKVTGLRIDHPDGLYDPKQYFQRLQQAYRSPAAPPREGAATEQGLYVLAEKILAMDEELPRDWPIAGTSGYDFLVKLNGLFVDQKNENAFSRIYQETTGNNQSFEDLAYQKKRLILRTSLASELHMLAHQLDRIAQRDRHWRDFTLIGLLDALREAVACFPVYRSYISSEGVSPRDVEVTEQAINKAIERNPKTEPSVFRFIRDALLQRHPASFSDRDRADLLRFAGKFQQLTAPVTAKGIEDTSFYIYNRLVSLNEVGGEPAKFGVSADELHQFFQDRQKHWPYALSGLSTHDTKRSEDVRARINVLSEIPDEWAQCVRQWRQITGAYRDQVDANDEYLLYQTLIGAWPEDGNADQSFIKRIQAYMQKAIREAKLHTSWTAPDQAYEDGLARFAQTVIEDGKFRESFLPLQQRVAKLGAINSLAQTLVKLTAPGVPDTYQGTELIDLSLVDPDNRRPVDYEKRRGMLRELGDAGNDLNRQKLLLTTRVLHLRNENPGMFSHGSYVPLRAEGPGKDQIFAFARRGESKMAVVIVPRLVAQMKEWGDTTVAVPDAPLPMKNLLTGEEIKDARIAVGELLRNFPVALLHW
ncbi:MAG TPA: malto-oligosyltrehalose synthase [Tepidisphaeraceae bacterium]|jgi:(1->4)-alpha-D-glucan 1-alpha-D-glucosylmutase